MQHDDPLLQCQSAALRLVLQERNSLHAMQEALATLEDARNAATIGKLDDAVHMHDSARLRAKTRIASENQKSTLTASTDDNCSTIGAVRQSEAMNNVGRPPQEAQPTQESAASLQLFANYYNAYKRVVLRDKFPSTTHVQLRVAAAISLAHFKAYVPNILYASRVATHCLPAVWSASIPCVSQERTSTA